MNNSIAPTATPSSMDSKNQTIEIFRRLEDNICSFELLKPEKMTLEIIFRAVYQCGMQLEHVPEHLRTRELCLLAASSEFASLIYAPEKHLDQDFIDFIFSSLERTSLWSFCEEKYKQVYRILPKCLLNQWHYEKLIKLNGVFLKWIPQDMKNYDLCFDALSSDGTLLKYVPNELIDKPMCYEALCRNNNARACVPDSLWDAHCERIIAKKLNGCRWHYF
ncbi:MULTISPECIES: DUF4116 domain-containing protein [unclassified Vibrio]|uniref:DUF4116 domain-containing protein n=1 Tax=unclassified Vibrio TaxID=2614977 RepID=UPI0014831A51|nr:MULTISPECIES: DUF4116 domain-containing protein [unclassified Vibrio]NNN43984.1 hypothetical protein [Vibrio sp. 1-1(7)]NNN71808.1 hypothetical protein [Vibrio sp. 12-2(3-a)]